MTARVPAWRTAARRIQAAIIADPTGVSRTDADTKGFFEAGCWLYLCAAVAHGSFAPVYLLAGFPSYAIVNVLTALTFAGAYQLHRHGRISLALDLGVLVAILRASFFTVMVGAGGAFHMELVAAAYFAMVFPWRRARERFTAIAILALAVPALALFAATHEPVLPLPPVLGAVVAATNVLVIGTTIGAFMWHATSVAREALRAAVRTREELLATVGHELRTPVSRVKMALGILEGEVPEDHVWAHQAAVQATDDLGDAVAQIMRYGTFVAGHRPLQIIALALHPFLTRLLADTSDQATLDLDTDLTVFADPSILRPALSNLLRNARRHGATRVSISALRLPHGAVEIHVEDDGPGVPEHLWADILRPLVRHGPTGGMGLGLAVVRRSARAHGATLEVGHSQRFGGARFTLTMPNKPVVVQHLHHPPISITSGASSDP